MLASMVAVVAALAASVTSKPASSYSAADWKKYHCVTAEKYLAWTPPCALNCLELGLGDYRDGCPIDDMVCHCAHSNRINEYLIPCISPPSVNATCTNEELGSLINTVNLMCDFYNSTGYADYFGCDKALTLEILEESLDEECE